MSRGLDLIRERMTGYLRQQGIDAVTAWPQEGRTAREDAAVSVSLRKCRGGPSGFQDYLGERYNAEAGRWEELYGKRVRLTFGLDLYAGQGGEAAIQRTFDTLAGALQDGGPEGMEVKEFSCGETVYDAKNRLFKRPAEAVCEAYLYAVAESGGAFLDFEIRGGMRQ